MAEFTARQTPIQPVILPCSNTKGIEAVELNESSGRGAIEWQEPLAGDVMATDDELYYTSFSAPGIAQLLTNWNKVHSINSVHLFI